MRVLITGGAGFIGSHIAESYLENGNEVYIIDDLSTGSINNIKHMMDDHTKNKRLFFYQDTIMNENKLMELIGTCDIVFHMAAAVGVRYILENPLKSIIINIQGTEKVLELCAKFKKRVLIASSSEVYGKHLHAPLVETDNIIYGPPSKFRWSYAASKLIDEFFAIAFNRMQGTEIIITRLFNTVGPRQTGAYGMVIPRLISQALKNEPLTVYGNGKQTRTFSHVKDIVNGLMLLMHNPNSIGEIFNVGGTNEISINDLAKKIIDAAGSSSEITYIPYEQAFTKDFEDMERRLPSIEKLKQLTGYQVRYTIDNIIDEVIEYQKRLIL